MPLFRFRFLLANAVLLFALVGVYWGRSIEDANVTVDDFLKKVDIAYSNWKPEDIPLTKDEREMLEPDSVVVRRFISPKEDQFAEVAVIAGHRKKTLHTPGFCMVGGGWEIVDQRDTTLKVAGIEIPAVSAVLQKDRARLLSTYFFTDGDYFTRSLPRFLAVQMVKRLRSRIPLGALVRVIVTAHQGRDKAESLTAAFSQTVLPPVFAGLRGVSVNRS